MAFYAVYDGVGRVTNKSTKETKSWRNGNVYRQSGAEASELHKFIIVAIEYKRQVRTRRADSRHRAPGSHYIFAYCCYSRTSRLAVCSWFIDFDYKGHFFRS